MVIKAYTERKKVRQGQEKIDFLIENLIEKFAYDGRKSTIDYKFPDWL